MMTVTTTTAGTALSEQQLSLLYQYTVEAYKTFEKYAENLPNPLSASMFKAFAVDERNDRDLLEMKIAASSHQRAIKATLGSDLKFSDLQEGDLSYREGAEFLIARERTMLRRMEEMMRSAITADRNLLLYLGSIKRSHLVELERELELIRDDGDWWKREDAEDRVVHGSRRG